MAKAARRASAADRRQAKDALFDAFASIAAAMGSGRRVQIIEVLAQGERTVEQVAGEIGQTLANTSHHLRTLARAGLVTSTRSGTHVHYRLASDDVAEAWTALRRVAAAHVDNLEELARAYLGDREELATITRDELRDRLERGDIVVIDVRPTPEYEAGHLPGAISIPPDRIGEKLDDLITDLPIDRDIVAYCRGPFCVYADDAVRHLTRQGRRALRLDDGLPEWRLAGGPTET
jgi:rhodanese-related sulfurtransferase/DNA-binding HxlR family transcriptional regulator